MYGGQTNLLGGEFWNEGSLGDVECKSASSAAHIYGKPITSAEAFTAGFKLVCPAKRAYVCTYWKFFTTKETGSLHQSFLINPLF